ncbi:MAG: hypothetical protein M5U33_06450 [Pseudorhodoplanes sp.]|nr:hypothetical protein [Pseudorhodoplanes sp.]
MVTAGALAGIDISAAYAGIANNANVSAIAARFTFPIIALAPSRFLLSGVFAGGITKGQKCCVETDLRQFGFV